jgi:hypothetical protein
LISDRPGAIIPGAGGAAEMTSEQASRRGCGIYPRISLRACVPASLFMLDSESVLLDSESVLLDLLCCVAWNLWAGTV